MTVILQCAAFGTDAVLPHLDLLGLLLSGFYTSVNLGELLLTHAQLFCSRLDVESGMRHQKLVAAGGTGNRACQFVGQLVDTGRDDTPFAAQVIETSGKVAQLPVDIQ